MTNEELGKAISNYFLNSILLILPSKTKLKRQAIEGIIKTLISQERLYIDHPLLILLSAIPKSKEYSK